MKRVIGIGGIFFKANDPEKLGAWYKKHLGLNVETWGGVSFQEGAGADLQPKRQSHLVWSPFEANTDYFAPSEKPFMINYRVHDLDALLTQLRSEGVEVDQKTEKSEFGYFGWIMDPEGNRIELWEPPPTEVTRLRPAAAGLRRGKQVTGEKRRQVDAASSPERFRGRMPLLLWR